MQKHKIYFFLAVLLWTLPNISQAAIFFLPHYQEGEFLSKRAVETKGRDKVCPSSYKYSCDGAGEISGQGKPCGELYKSCMCTSSYQWSNGKCRELTCEDYHYLDLGKTNPEKHCEEVEVFIGLTCLNCTDCDTNIYKYDCSGRGFSSTQSDTYKCGKKYSQCVCSGLSSWDAKQEKCVCTGEDLIEENDVEGQKTCRLKKCDDYGYASDNEEDIYEGLICAEKKVVQRYGDGKASTAYCYDCQCDNAYKYDCQTSSSTHITKGDGYACKNGKYKACICDDLTYWSNGACVLKDSGCNVKTCTEESSCVDENGNAAPCTYTHYDNYSTASKIGEGIDTFNKCLPRTCGGPNLMYGYRATSCHEPYELINGMCSNKGTCEYYGYYTTQPTQSYYSCSKVALSIGDCFDCYNVRNSCIEFFGGNVNGGLQTDGPDVDNGWTFTITNASTVPAADTFDFDYKDSPNGTGIHSVILATDETIFGDIIIRNANLISPVWQYVDSGLEDCKSADFSDMMDLNGTFTVINDKTSGFITPEINASSLVLEGNVTFLNRVYADKITIKEGSSVKFYGGLGSSGATGVPEIHLDYRASIDFNGSSDVMSYLGRSKSCQGKVIYSTFEELEGVCPNNAKDPRYWYWKETENTVNISSCSFSRTAGSYQCGISECYCDGTYGSTYCDRVATRFPCQQLKNEKALLN